MLLVSEIYPISRQQEEQERKDRKRRDAEMEMIRRKEEAKEKADEAIKVSYA